MTRKTKSELESTVKALLRERSMSMRQLAAHTGIHVAIISKMIAGKQRANPDYLQRIARDLGVSSDVLFVAAGFDVGNSTGNSLGLDSLNMIREIMHDFNMQVKLSKADIADELTKYEEYAKTNEGQQLIVDKFPEKRKQITGAGRFVDDLDALYQQFLHTDISVPERFILGGGLLYFILSTDVIPDYVFPIGYVDDVIATQITHDRLLHISHQGNVANENEGSFQPENSAADNPLDS